MWEEILSTSNFLSVGSIKDVVIFEVDWSRMTSWNVVETDTASEGPGIDFDGQSLQIGYKFHYLGCTIEARPAAIDSVLARKRNESNKFGNLISLITNSSLPFEAKSRIHSLGGRT